MIDELKCIVQKYNALEDTKLTKLIPTLYEWKHKSIKELVSCKKCFILFIKYRKTRNLIDNFITETDTIIQDFRRFNQEGKLASFSDDSIERRGEDCSSTGFILDTTTLFFDELKMHCAQILSYLQENILIKNKVDIDSYICPIMEKINLLFNHFWIFLKRSAHHYDTD